MDNSILPKIKDALAKSNNIGIVVGQNPTLDQMAAALSLYLSLNQVNKKTTVATPENPLVEVSSLVGIDKVQTNLGGDAGDLVVSFPYVEGEIEKVSYTLENEFLNIIVKAGANGLSFDERDVRYIRGSGTVDLLFVIGTPRLSELGELLSGDKLKEAMIINIDNKSENQNFGDIVLVTPQASSLSEQIGDLLLALGLPVDQDSAQNLFSGIVSATQNFQSPQTSSLAFEVAGFLMRKGATRPRETRQEASQFTPKPLESKHVQDSQGVEERLPQRTPRFEEEEKPQPKIDEDKAPLDWLTPKVYKGSSNV
ncbi:MAG TPA: hypothetical protein VE090_05820 [Methylomirabilota bacterium]|nr:hypothetical protein [Methylomirabilota bacterium]